MKYQAHLEAHERTHMGGFRRIYPNGNEEEYAKFFDQSTSLCAETAASRARAELSRQQREEIEAKQKELQQWRRKVQGGGEGLQPESPHRERKGSACSEGGAVIRRRTSFRLPGPPHKVQQQKHTEVSPA